jgi:predicted AlkP superfamily phosphohydrolase/phosphomutase
VTSRRLRLLFLGLDGADPRTMRRLLDARRLPALARLAAEGTCRPLRSTVPPATYPAWATCLTGVNPGRHGVLDFTTTAGYGVRFGAPRPARPTWLETLSATGFRVGAVGFPGRLHAGVLSAFHVAGWDAPLETAAGRRHVRPPALFDRIRRELGRDALRFATFDEFAARDRAWPKLLAARLRESLRARVALALFLQRERPAEVLAVHFQALDTAGHHAWPRPDEADGIAPAGPAVPHALAAVHEALDEALGVLRRELEPEHVVAVSDHGMGPTADLVVSLNALLVDGGLQRRAPPAVRDRTTRWARQAALRVTPASLRKLAGAVAGRALADVLESTSRHAGIDLARSAAFSDELTYAPSVRLNVRGREPDGIVEPADRERVARDVVVFLRGIRRPDGEALFAEARLREEVYDGPFVERAPDVLLSFAEDRAGRSPLLCPPHLRGKLGGAWHMPVPSEEHDGRKGGLLRGSHRPWGVLFASFVPSWLATPDEIDLRDVAPLVYEHVGVPEPPGLEKPRRAPRTGEASRAARGDDDLTAQERRTLARRLRALGYVEDADG